MFEIRNVNCGFFSSEVEYIKRILLILNSNKKKHKTNITRTEIKPQQHKNCLSQKRFAFAYCGIFGSHMMNEDQHKKP